MLIEADADRRVAECGCQRSAQRGARRASPRYGQPGRKITVQTIPRQFVALQICDDMSRRRGRRRHRRSRAVTFPRCPPSDTHADQKGGRLRFLKAAAITVLILVAVTSIAGVVMTAQSLSNTGEDKPTINLPPYGSKGDDQAGSGDSEGLSPHSVWKGVRVKPRDFVEKDTEIHNGPDGTVSTDAHLIPDAMIEHNRTQFGFYDMWELFSPDFTTVLCLESKQVPVRMTPPTGHAENTRVPDNQTETFRSEGWKRFRVEQNHTEGVDSTTEVPTVPPHVVGDEEEEVAHDWGYTTGGNHCNDARVPVCMTPPAGHAENARVPDNQTETFRSEGWKRFRVEQNHTEGVCSTTEAPTVSPHVVGDEEGEAAYDWGYTTGGNHCNNARVRRRVSKVPRHDSETYPATDDSSAANMTHLEPKLNCSLDQKFSGDVDSKKGATAAMDSVHAKNSTDLNLYLDAVLTDIMKIRKRKHRSVLKRIKRSKAIVVLAAVGVLIAGSVAHFCLGRIVQ
ncbi:Chchd3p [Branchiostoma belcheri]|nr:Chchd3p [Branchiostoma belcheri]